MYAFQLGDFLGSMCKLEIEVVSHAAANIVVGEVVNVSLESLGGGRDWKQLYKILDIFPEPPEPMATA